MESKYNPDLSQLKEGIYLSFDPGKTTGWAMFTPEGDGISFGQLTIEELIDKCREWEHAKIIAVIYEDFIIFKHKAQKQAGSRVEAAQAIGIIKGLAQHTGAELIRQGSDIKPMAQKWTQLKPVGRHADNHWVDAFNHGAFYLIKQGIRKTYLEAQSEQG